MSLSYGLSCRKDKVLGKNPLANLVSEIKSTWQPSPMGRHFDINFPSLNWPRYGQLHER